MLCFSILMHFSDRRFPSAVPWRIWTRTRAQDWVAADSSGAMVRGSLRRVCFPTVFNDLIVLSGLAARFPRSRFFGRADRTWANEMEAAEVDWVPGAYSIIRTEALAAVGLFRPAFFPLLRGG